MRDVHIEASSLSQQDFELNRDATYQEGGIYPIQMKGASNIQNPTVWFLRIKQLAEPFSSISRIIIFEKFRMSYVESDQLLQAWYNNPMQFGQN